MIRAGTLLVASLLPFGTFVADKRLRREDEAARARRAQPELAV